MAAEDLIGFLIYMFVFSNALMLSLLFFTTKSENKKANIFLGLFLLSTAVQIFNDFLGEFPIGEKLRISSFMVEPFLFTLPFLFFYLYRTINKKIKNRHYLLFIPGAFHNLLLHFDGLFLTKNGITIYEASCYFLEIALMVHLFKIVQSNKDNIINFYSDLEHKSLLWLKTIFIVVILIHFSSFVTVVFDLSNMEILEYIVENTSFGLLVFMIFWIAYNGFSQSEIFKQRLFLETTTETLILEESPNTILIDNLNTSNEIVEEEYIEEQMNTEQDIQRFIEIKEKTQTQELYTNPKLNLHSLAKDLGLKEKELSRLINQCGNVNFYRFINEFRIKKFKQLLQSSKAQQFTLLGLAMESGFPSKSTFYTAFKELEGMTPKQYKMSIKKS